MTVQSDAPETAAALASLFDPARTGSALRALHRASEETDALVQRVREDAERDEARRREREEAARGALAVAAARAAEEFGWLRPSQSRSRGRMAARF